MISIKAVNRIAILVVGSTVLAIGVALLVLPGPAFIVIPVGFAILAVEFAWARRWLHKARELLPNTNGAGSFSSFVVRRIKNFLEWASVPTREHQGTERTKGQKMKPENEANQLSPAEKHPVEDDVARRAYELYQARGAEPGHDLEDWLQAEREVNGHGQIVQSV